MRKEIGKKVADHLRKFPGFSFPAPSNEEWDLKLFEAPFSLTDEEGEVLANVMPYFESPRDIAGRMGRDTQEVIPLLDSLVRKLWVFCEGSGEDRRYEAHTCQFEFYMPWLTPESVARLLSPLAASAANPDPKDVEFNMRPIGTGEDEMLPYLRVVPREGSLPFDAEILPAELVSHLIDHAGEKGIAVTECLCRKIKQSMGGSCSYNGPLDQCLFFEPFAQAAVEAGVARPIGKAEAHEIVKRAREYGLVHQAATAEHTRVLCSCCPDCCGALQPFLLGMQAYGYTSKSNFYSSVKPGRCKGALDCVKKCPAGALSFDEVRRTAAVALEKCIGCGICVESCGNGAIELKRREKVIRYPHTNDDHWELNARQRGKTELMQRR